MKKVMVIFLFMLIASSLPVFASDKKGTKGNWETEVYLDNLEIITRVVLDNDNEIAVELEELSEIMGYSVEWSEYEQCITLQKGDEKIKIYVDKYSCEKNGEEINLDKPVFIDYESAYLPQTFLLNIFAIDTVKIDQEAKYRRVNGLFLADRRKLKNDLIIVSSNEFSLVVTPKDSVVDGQKVLFSFSLGVEKDDIGIDMNYEEFFKTNEAEVAKVVKEQLEKTHFNELKKDENMTNFKINLVDKINEHLNVQIVKYIYITQHGIYYPL